MALGRFLATGSLLAGLSLGAMGLPARSALAQQAPQAPTCLEPTLTTRGHGEVRVPPDSLQLSVGVQVQAKTLDEARRLAGAAMERVREGVKRLPLPGLTLQTQLLDVTPIREVQNGRPAAVTGFQVANDLLVTLLDAPPADLGTDASRILEAAIDAGASSTGGLRFFLRDLRGAQTRALDAAVRDAQASAQAMAAAAGGGAGGICALDGSPGGGPILRSFASVEAAAQPAATPVESGEVTVTADVTARFAFHR